MIPFNTHKNMLPLFPDSIPGLAHGSFTSHSGVSTGPFTSNNISHGVGDKKINVQQNRELIKERLGLQQLVSAHQVHGKSICHVTEPVDDDFEIDGYDAIISNQPGVGLLIQHADCQAVMVYDQKNRMVAGIHNGWRGSVENIIADTIAAMELRYGTIPNELVAAVGPSLGPCCSEFINHRDELPESFLPYQVRENHFDFWQISLQQLTECGVGKDSVIISGVCTSCSSDFFSYRRGCKNGNGITGRNGTVIALI